MKPAAGVWYKTASLDEQSNQERLKKQVMEHDKELDRLCTLSLLTHYNSAVMFSYCCVKWPVCWLQLRLASTDSLPIIHRTDCTYVSLLPSPHLSVSHSPHIVFFFQFRFTSIISSHWLALFKPLSSVLSTKLKQLVWILE